MFSKDDGVVMGCRWAKNRPTTVCLTPSSISSTPPTEMILFFSTPVTLTTLFLPFRGELVPGTQPVCTQTAVKEFLFLELLDVPQLTNKLHWNVLCWLIRQINNTMVSDNE